MGDTVMCWINISCDCKYPEELSRCNRSLAAYRLRHGLGEINEH
jgi:hypothetical protein